MTLASRTPIDGTCRHVRTLAAALVWETAELQSMGAPVQHLVGDVECLPAAIDLCESASEAFELYLRLRDQLAAALDGGYVLAARYASMDQFWADAAAQERGERLDTYWDSYEHGLRRMLEQRLASAYGSDQAVLVNSGMSAIDVALRSVGLRPGSTVLAHHRAYFETDQYLLHVLAETGVRVRRADLTDRHAVRRALADSPDAVLVEPVLNGPSCDVPILEPLLAAGVPIVVDNSVLGHALSGALLSPHGQRVLVAESGSKYLCRQASSGMLYGWGDLITAARLTARRTGQQLQGRALHRLRTGEIWQCAARLALHASRAGVFRGVLTDQAPWLRVSDATTGAADRDDLLARHIRGGARGCLSFVSCPVDEHEAEQVHRTVVQRWCASHGARVRAGFGWTATTGRAYGADALNTDAGRSFIRVSVGLEPEEEVRALAAGFVAAAKATLAGDRHTTRRAGSP